MENRQMAVWQKGRDTYKVSSESQEGQYYRVREVQGIWVCSCPRFTNRHSITECKHIARIKEALRLEQVIDDSEIGKVIKELKDIMGRIAELSDKLEEVEEGNPPSSLFY